MARQLIREEIGGVRVAEDARISVLVHSDLCLYGSGQNSQGTEPVIRVVGEIAGNRRRQPGAVAHDAGDLPSADDLIDPSRSIPEQRFVLSDRQLKKIVRADVVSNVEIRGAAEFIDVENILNRGALLSGTGFRR